MACCATGGAPVEGQFCAKCGSRVGAAPSVAAGPSVKVAAAMADNVASSLCYVLGLITGIIFLVLTPYNRNPVVRFHAFQSIFLNVACIVASFVLDRILDVMHLWALEPLISLAILATFIFMIIMTYQWKKIVVPVIGPIARQQAGK